ncbi:MAG: hypothetical protein CMM50_12315 [Rhodospirillaceae bacterium]|nr:hypothetical protein [Rhodospirillaceae bacterium]
MAIGSGDINDGEVIFAFHRVGESVRVTAVHPATLTEVTIVGSVHTLQARLEQVALNKLRYVMAKRYGGDSPAGSQRR